MGIDICARWKGQTKLEMEAQFTSSSDSRGAMGYLREAYHGHSYATAFLCSGAFVSPNGRAFIPAAVLRDRLPETLKLAKRRQRVVYQEKDRKEIAAVLQSLRDFVDFCERKEKGTGTPVEIWASF